MAKLKMSTLSSLNASRSFSHHSLDSANPYGRYGGGGSIPGGSLQPSPQIYSHHHGPGLSSQQQPLSIHQSHQNIGGPSGGKSSLNGSQNSLHASYLQMYSNTLSQRSRQNSGTSLNQIPMQQQPPISMNTYGQQHQVQSQPLPSTSNTGHFGLPALHAQQPLQRYNPNLQQQQQQQQPSSSTTTPATGVHPQSYASYMRNSNYNYR